MKELTKIEEILLLSIWRPQENAYGVKIRQQAEKITKKEFTYGNLYSALDQLGKKSYVSKIVGEPTSERGGRRKIYYKLNEDGLQALKAAMEMKDALWEGVSKYAFDGR